MITTYLSEKKLKPEIITQNNQNVLNTAIWIDLLNPTKEEENLIEETLNIDIPTREEMQEIEFSSRLYKESDALFMTVIMVAKSTTFEPTADAVTLILAKNKLITIRYTEPYSFSLLISHLSKLSSESYNAISLLVELLDVSIDRLADILENLSRQLEDYSHTIFRPTIDKKPPNKLDYKTLLEKVGASGDLNTKVQESLISFNRLMAFFEKNASSHLENNIQSKLKLISKDAKSLRDHVIFLFNKVNFLLDATLGMVNIEQNNIIKMFSIAAVIFLPPTLVASIYGMNFDFIPELKWYWGYPFSIGLMIFSAWLPYKYFKKKNWL